MGYGVEDMDARVVRGAVASFVSGCIFAAAWWLLIDGYAMGNKQKDAATAATAGYAWVPPFFASLMYFAINAMVRSQKEGGCVLVVGLGRTPPPPPPLP